MNLIMYFYYKKPQKILKYVKRWYDIINAFELEQYSKDDGNIFINMSVFDEEHAHIISSFIYKKFEIDKYETFTQQD